MRLRLFVAAASLLSASLALHAATITYTATYTEAGGTVGTGTLVFDAAGIAAQSPKPTLDSFSATVYGYSFSSASYSLNATYAPNGDLYSDALGSTNTAAGLTLGDSGGIPYPTGVAFYLADASRTLIAGGNVTLTPAIVASTPEPSSLVLLGTGLIGALGVTRRRFAASGNHAGRL